MAAAAKSSANSIGKQVDYFLSLAAGWLVFHWVSPRAIVALFEANPRAVLATPKVQLDVAAGIVTDRVFCPFIVEDFLHIQ